jgi:hypothetical protein
VEELKSVSLIFEQLLTQFKLMTSRERINFDDLEVVLADVINNRTKPRRVGNIFDLMEALNDGSKPIGILWLQWADVNAMIYKEFPNLTTEEGFAIAEAFAQAQDQMKEQLKDTFNED